MLDSDNDTERVDLGDPQAWHPPPRNKAREAEEAWEEFVIATIATTLAVAFLGAVLWFMYEVCNALGALPR